MRFLLVGFIIAMTARIAYAEDGAVGQQAVRGPIALEFVNEDQIACVVNQKSGSLSLIDLQSRSVISEETIGGTPQDLAVCLKQETVLVVDSANHQIVAASFQGHRLKVRGKLSVEQHPVRIIVSADGRQAFVSCLWSRRVVQVELEFVGDQLRFGTRRTIDLPFAPREMLLLPSSRTLVVADAFAGAIGVVDTRSGVIESVRMIPGHNLRGLVLSPSGDRLIVAQQVLNPLAPTTRDNIIWSVLMTNCLRSISITRLLDPGADLMEGSRFIPLGTVRRGAGDPGDFAVDESGRLFVCLSGVHQVALLSTDGRQEERFVTGQRPVAIAVEPTGKGFLIANQFSDSLTWIPSSVEVESSRLQEQKAYAGDDYATRNPSEARNDLSEISLGIQPELTLAQQGERIFYDATLSHDHWMSCHSCHTDGHTNGGLADTLGDGNYGAPKQIPTLMGTAKSGPWAWDGSVHQLREQIRKSMVASMQGPGPSKQQLDALQAFLATLSPAPPVQVVADSSRMILGRRLFERYGCADCHEGDRFTSGGTFDVGLIDEMGKKQFNPPSLLGVSQRVRWFHDGRAESLKQVIDDTFPHPAKLEIVAEEIEILLDYLRRL